MNKQKGIASMVIMIAMLVMVVALPITTKLVQQNQENRSKAADFTDLGNGTKVCALGCYEPYVTGQTKCSDFNMSGVGYTGPGKDGTCKNTYPKSSDDTSLCCTTIKNYTEKTGWKIKNTAPPICTALPGSNCTSGVGADYVWPDLGTCSKRACDSINGKCGETYLKCETGNIGTTTPSTWKCNGTNGGANVDCSFVYVYKRTGCSSETGKYSGCATRVAVVGATNPTVDFITETACRLGEGSLCLINACAKGSGSFASCNDIGGCIWKGGYCLSVCNGVTKDTQKCAGNFLYNCKGNEVQPNPVNCGDVGCNGIPTPNVCKCIKDDTQCIGTGTGTERSKTCKQDGTWGDEIKCPDDRPNCSTDGKSCVEKVGQSTCSAEKCGDCGTLEVCNGKSGCTWGTNGPCSSVCANQTSGNVCSGNVLYTCGINKVAISSDLCSSNGGCDPNTNKCKEVVVGPNPCEVKNTGDKVCILNTIFICKNGNIDDLSNPESCGSTKECSKDGTSCVDKAVVPPVTTCSSTCTGCTEKNVCNTQDGCQWNDPECKTCPRKAEGDADCDGDVGMIDLSAWITEFIKEANGEVTDKTADFDGSDTIAIGDFNRWHNTMLLN